MAEQYGRDAQELDVNVMLRTLDHIKVYESSVVVTVFFDGTEIEHYTEQKEKKDI